MKSSAEPLQEAEEVDRPEMVKEESMQSSEMTPTTETGSVSVSEEESGTGGWFGIESDIKTFARSIKDNIPPALGGFASFIHRSAMTVAAEIAQLEREAELETERWREENYGKAHDTKNDDGPLHLPWEVPHTSSNFRSSSCETIYEEDDELKAVILDLSRHEDSFLVAREESQDGDDSFSMDEPRIDLIRRLIEIDENLAAIHAKLSGRSDVKEAQFWRNYFNKCERVRREYLAQQESIVNPVDLALSGSLGSLEPSESEKGDDSSYVNVRNFIASPPSSLNTDMSLGDMVLVKASLKDLEEDECM